MTTNSRRRSGGRSTSGRSEGGSGRDESTRRPPKGIGRSRNRERETATAPDVLEDDLEWGGAGHNSRNAVEEVEPRPVERVAEPTTMQERLLDPDKSRARAFVADELKPELSRLADASNEALYLALAKVYQIVLVILGSKPNHGLEV